MQNDQIAMGKIWFANEVVSFFSLFVQFECSSMSVFIYLANRKAAKFTVHKSHDREKEAEKQNEYKTKIIETERRPYLFLIYLNQQLQWDLLTQIKLNEWETADEAAAATVIAAATVHWFPIHKN